MRKSAFGVIKGSFMNTRKWSVAVLGKFDKKTRCFFRVDLLFNIDGIIDILSSSKTIEMPAGAEVLSDFRPGKNENISEILKLSGFNKLLLEHYKNHRESFS